MKKYCNWQDFDIINDMYVNEIVIAAFQVFGFLMNTFYGLKLILRNFWIIILPVVVKIR